jgi:hypothetical protein
MTTKSKTRTIADLDDEQSYLVDLSAPVKVGRTWARPGQRVEMKGRVIKEHASNVADVRPLTD